VTSTSQDPELHCAGNSQTVPVARKALHKPVARSQPSPHSNVVSESFSQTRETDPSHSAPLPSHCAHPDPSLEHEEPWAAHASAQHTVLPVAVASQVPLAHSAAEVH
jgi:hypothetical protein